MKLELRPTYYDGHGPLKSSDPRCTCVELACGACGRPMGFWTECDGTGCATEEDARLGNHNYCSSKCNPCIDMHGDY